MRILFLLMISLLFSAGVSAQTESPPSFLFVDPSTSNPRLEVVPTQPPLFDRTVVGTERDLALKATFLRQLYSQTSSESEARKNLALNRYGLTESQAKEIQAIVQEWMNYSLSLVSRQQESMCRYWENRTGERSDAESAELALRVWEDQDLSSFEKNALIDTVFETIEQRLGSETAVRLLELYEHRRLNSHFTYVEWPDAVRGRARQVEELNFVCGGSI